MTLTYEALAAIRAQWEDARAQRQFAHEHETGTESYFAGKYFGIVESVAAIEGMTWADADDLLRHMGQAVAA